MSRMGKIQHSRTQTLLVLKDGIKGFVKRNLKNQHHELLKKASKSANDRGIFSCSECTQDNLLTIHSKDSCPSKRECLCKKKSIDLRPCPNGICDKAYERIIMLHATYSPNIKNTNISRWCEDYMELAKCFMRHNPESFAKTDLMDLLRIMANNTPIRKKLGLLGYNGWEPEEDFLNEVIQYYKRIRRQGMVDTKLYVETYHYQLIMLLDAVSDKNARKAISTLTKGLQTIKESESGFCFKQAEQMPQCMSKEDFLKSLEKHFKDHWIEAKKDFENADDSIQLDFLQEVSIFKRKREELALDKYHMPRPKKTTLAQEILNEIKDNRDSLVFYDSNDEKNWFLDNILRWKFQCNMMEELTNILILSELYAKKLKVTILELCTMAYNALESEKDFLVVVDTSEELINSYLAQFENCKKGHIFVRLISKKKMSKYRNQDTQILNIWGIKELIISDNERSGKVYLSKYPESIKCCLHRCFRKVKGCTLEKITFKNLVFDEQLIKIKVPVRNGLKIIKLEGSKMIPAANFEQLELHNVSFKSSEIKTLCENVRGIKSLVLLGSKKHIFKNLKLLTSFWHYCPTLERIETAECTVGNNCVFTLKIERNEIDECCKFSFSKNSSSCTINELTCMVQHVINRQMISKFTRYDFENSNREAEKQFIMNAICYSLLQKHDSYVNVYPAKFKGEGETTLVCITKENCQNVLLKTLPDLKQRRGYVGFRIVEKDVYSFSAANLSCPQEAFDDQLQKYYVNHFDSINEVIAFQAERLLNEHKNLVSISVSLGKVKNEYVDVTLGPHIVLYVNAKSYIPIFEKAFPEELKHNYDSNIVYPVDVREGYFISMADSESNRRAKDKLSKLAMGCSIGPENGQTGGTMGPLVEYKTANNLTFLGFLTACHIFRKPEDADCALNTVVVQPSNIDEPVDINTGTIRQTPNKRCGQIVACRFSEYVDAALVRIDERHPTATNFITPTYDDLNNAGFSLFGSFGLPKYQKGRSLHESQLTVKSGNAAKRIVKFGNVTGLRRGCLMLDQTVVRLRNHTLRGFCPSSMPLKVEFNHELKNQMTVWSSPESSFFQKGDSGCGVFLADDNNDLWCIGVGIGMLSDSNTIVTPIHTILEELQSCVGINEIRLKSFEAEDMMT